MHLKRTTRDPDPIERRAMRRYHAQRAFDITVKSVIWVGLSCVAVMFLWMPVGIPIMTARNERVCEEVTLGETSAEFSAHWRHVDGYPERRHVGMTTIRTFDTRQRSRFDPDEGIYELSVIHTIGMFHATCTGTFKIAIDQLIRRRFSTMG